MSGEDFIDAGFDCLRQQTQKRLNNFASETFLKCSSKTVNNLASNSGASQSVIALNTKATAKIT